LFLLFDDSFLEKGNQEERFFWKREISRRGRAGADPLHAGMRGQARARGGLARGVEAWNCPWPLDGGEAFSDKIWVVGFHMKIFLGA
jgi:hypothetical protein